LTSAGLALAAGGAAAAAAAGFAVPPSALAAAGFRENHEELPPLLAGAGSSFFLNQFRTLSLPVDESTMKRAKMTPGEEKEGGEEGCKKVREEKRRKNLAVEPSWRFAIGNVIPRAPNSDLINHLQALLSS
jgi:hypothetical protein